MSVILKRIAAGLPERRAPDKGSFVTETKALRIWIEQLPLANPGATARMLHSAVREMNQLRLDANQRLEALEQLRGPIGQIVATLDKQIISDSFPLPPAKQQLGNLAQEFQKELAIGYSAVICDMCTSTGAVPFLKGKFVVLALIRAIQHQGARLAKAYLLYCTPAAGVWRTLHDLFRFAVASRMDDKAMGDILLEGAQISARGAYAHALLLALTNPYHFSQRENLEIYAVTRTWAPYCDIREGVSTPTAVAIPIDSDLGPGYLQQEREAPGAGVWSVDTGGLTRFIDGQMAVRPPGVTLLNFRLRGGPQIHTETELVERMLRGWTDRSQRVLIRLPAQHQLDTVIGLSNLHYALAGNKNFEDFLFTARGMARDLGERDKAATWNSGGASEQVRVVRHRAKVLDQSLGGYRLQWEKGESIRIRIGDLIGLAPPVEVEENQDWMIGEIRWIRIDDAGAVGIGVALLGRQAEAIGVRSLSETGKPGHAVRGILLEPINEDATVASLLAPLALESNAKEVEFIHQPDAYSFAFQPTLLMEKRQAIRVVDKGGLYLDFEVPIVKTSDTAGMAANDDLPADANSASERG